MLHKFVTISLVLVGLVLAGLSVASGTLWRPSDTAVMTTGTQSGATLLTTAPGVLGLVDDSVTITATSSADAKVVLAIGRAVDVEGWIGEDPVLEVTGASDWETLSVTAPTSPDEPTEPPAEDAPAEEPPVEEAPVEEAPVEEIPAEEAPLVGPDPEVSDMWLTSAVGTESASLTWDASSSDEVLLVAAVGEDAATPQLTLSWPREVTTPLMWPGVLLGALLVLAGCVYGFFFLRSRDRVASAPTNSSAMRAAARQRAAAIGRPVTDSTESTDGSAVTQGSAGAAGSSFRQTISAGTGALVGVSSASDATESRTGLTRRELREQAALAEHARLEEVNAAARRTKRAWPWTGAIPMVKKTETAPPAPAAPPVVDPARPVWLPAESSSSSGSSWRQAWGVRPEAAPTDGPAPLNTAPRNNTTTEGS